MGLQSGEIIRGNVATVPNMDPDQEAALRLGCHEARILPRRPLVYPAAVVVERRPMKEVGAGNTPADRESLSTDQVVEGCQER